MSVSFAGLGVALATPFKASGELDEGALRKLVRRQVEGGVDVLVPCGTTGEAATMTEAEQLRVVAIALEESQGRSRVLAGAGSNDTKVAIARSRKMAEVGAHGVLSVGPFYNKPTPEGFFRHFTAVAEASPVPVVLYNVPSRTGSNIDAKTLLRLATHPNIVGVKEASGSMAQMMEILRDRPKGFLFLSGDDAVTLPLMALGAEGVISVAGNEVPGEMKGLVAAAASGDFAKARGIHERLLHLMNLNFVESSPVPLKCALALLGVCEEVLRLPLWPATDATREAMRRALKDLGLVA
jgi:4-hydroxy-tetrahydrodipicolinate synthase